MRERAKRIISNPKVLTAGALLLAWGILGGTILLGQHQLRSRVRQQISDQHAQVLTALWQTRRDGGEGADSPELGALDPGDQLIAALETSRLPQVKGVLATLLFDAEGKLLVTIPEYVADGRINREDLERMRQLKPVSHFIPAAKLSDISLLAHRPSRDETLPLLEVTLPVSQEKGGELIGVARFVLDGQGMAAEFAKLDLTLAGQGLAAFVVGCGVLGAGLGWAFRQLQASNRLLADRTRSLLQANAELALAAKTSAVGAVTAHLIHGLKNPLSGLQLFMASKAANPEDTSGEEWQLAASTATRMQQMVNEVVRVLREDPSAGTYELSVREMIELVRSRVKPLADDHGVEFGCRATGESTLFNREANLILLILENLAHNAIQATPRGGAVELAARCGNGGGIVWEVRDGGPGMPDGVRERLFKPCNSTKEKGSGIGLAISKQLANSIGASLELQSSSPEGCVFALRVPGAEHVANSLSKREDETVRNVVV